MGTETDTLSTDERVLNAPLWTVVRVAEIAAEMYDCVENPGSYDDEDGPSSSSEAVLEWFPLLRGALYNAGLLRK